MSPSLELQTALVTDLKAQSSITALVGGRVYDNVPERPIFPYVAFGPEDHTNEDAECIRAQTVYFQLDVWSREPSSAECRKILDALKRRIEGFQYSITSNAVVGEAQIERERVMRDSDGRTWHGILSVYFDIEQL